MDINEELLNRIFIGGIEEFKDNGMKFTMDSLAKRIGISKRTLYENISSKNELIELVIDRTFLDVKRQQKLVLQNNELTTIEKLRQLFLIVPVYSNIIDYRRMDELKISYHAIYKKIQDNLENDWEPTICLLQKAMDEGTIRRTNIIILKLLLCEIFEKLIDGKMLIKNNISYEDAMNEMMDIVFKGLLIET